MMGPAIIHPNPFRSASAIGSLGVAVGMGIFILRDFDRLDMVLKIIVGAGVPLGIVFMLMKVWQIFNSAIRVELHAHELVIFDPDRTAYAKAQIARAAIVTEYDKDDKSFDDVYLYLRDPADPAQTEKRVRLPNGNFFKHRDLVEAINLWLGLASGATVQPVTTRFLPGHAR
jgi:hypothetical protein